MTAGEGTFRVFLVMQGIITVASQRRKRDRQMHVQSGRCNCSFTDGTKNLFLLFNVEQVRMNNGKYSS